MTMNDAVVGGIHIPPGVIIQLDVFSMHYDAEVWGPVDPYEFYPERYSLFSIYFNSISLKALSGVQGANSVEC